MVYDFREELRDFKRNFEKEAVSEVSYTVASSWVRRLGEETGWCGFEFPRAF